MSGNESLLAYLRSLTDIGTTPSGSYELFIDTGGGAMSKVTISEIAAAFPVGPQGNPGPVAHKSIVMVVNGNGSLVAPGVYSICKCGFGGTITSMGILTDQSTTTTLHILKVANGSGVPTTSNYIDASSPISLSSSQELTTSSFTGWTSTTVTKNDNFALDIVTNSAAQVIYVRLDIAVASE